MRALCLVLALVMVLGMLPGVQVRAAEGTTLYLVPNSNWKNDNARFAIYYWNASGTSSWVSMTDSDSDGVYEGTVPAGYGRRRCWIRPEGRTTFCRRFLRQQRSRCNSSGP